MKVAIVGAGWAGMAAAVEAADKGAEVTVFEATRHLGGRARALPVRRADGSFTTLDNGQHILIGAYSETLSLMERVGVDLDKALLALPLALPYADGRGLQTPPWAARWPAPLDAVAAILTARGWQWSDRIALVKASLAWKKSGFECAPELSVARLCAGLPERVMAELIEPLCVSALNIEAFEASAQVFLRVMRDALFGKGHGGLGASNLLLPRIDLSSAFPLAAQRWLMAQHPERCRLHTAARVVGVSSRSPGWCLRVEQQGSVQEHSFDQVILATAAGPAAQAMGAAAQWVLEHGDAGLAERLQAWAHRAAALNHTAITTVYAWDKGVRLPRPLLALRALPDAHTAPAQFVFDRGQLQPQDAGAQGLLAFVISASAGEREDLQNRVLLQAARQLGLNTLQPLQTVVEKRATFACTPGLQRPPLCIAPGLWAAGDHVEGPYPATLEGAVRSGLAAARVL